MACHHGLLLSLLRVLRRRQQFRLLQFRLLPDLLPAGLLEELLALGHLFHRNTADHFDVSVRISRRCPI